MLKAKYLPNAMANFNMLLFPGTLAPHSPYLVRLVNSEVVCVSRSIANVYDLCSRQKCVKIQRLWVCGWIVFK